RFYTPSRQILRPQLIFFSSFANFSPRRVIARKLAEHLRDITGEIDRGLGSPVLRAAEAVRSEAGAKTELNEDFLDVKTNTPKTKRNCSASGWDRGRLGRA